MGKECEEIKQNPSTGSNNAEDKDMKVYISLVRSIRCFTSPPLDCLLVFVIKSTTSRKEKKKIKQTFYKDVTETKSRPRVLD